jgi:hypothetical protein
MRKLIYIQNSEIDKLRRMLKAAKQEHFSLLGQENRPVQAATTALKEPNRGKKSPILISDESEHAELESRAPKRKKCGHRVEAGNEVDGGWHSKSRSFHCTSKEEIGKKSSCKGRRDKLACR